MALLSVAALTLVVAAPLSGRAQEVEEDEGPAARPNTIVLQVGVASAVGFSGLTYARTFEDVLQVEAGVGIGASGTQLSLMPKIVLGNRSTRFVTGAGFSVAIPANPQHSTGHPVWLNVDALGVELTSSFGFTFMAAAGITAGLGGGTLCTALADGCQPGEKLSNVAGMWGPQFRLGWGYSF